VSLRHIGLVKDLGGQLVNQHGSSRVRAGTN